MPMGLDEPTSVFYRPTVTTVPKPPNAIRDANFIKLAVRTNLFPDKLPQLVKFDPKRSLAEIVEEICSQWQINNPEDHALKLEHRLLVYITDQNKDDLRNGDILQLDKSPKVICADILRSLRNPEGSPEARNKALQILTRLAVDPSVSEEFFRLGGLQVVTRMIETAAYNESGLPWLLQSFSLLMDSGHASWDDVSESLLAEVASYVAGRVKTVEQSALPAALQILDTAVNHRTRSMSVVQVDSLIRHLDNSDASVQQNALALMNSLFMKAASQEDRALIAQSLSSKAMTSSLENGVFRRPNISAEMAHQLGVLQCLLLNTLEPRYSSPVNVQDQNEVDKVLEIRRRAFSNMSDRDQPLSPGSLRKHGAHAKDFKKLGFKHCTNPIEDFTVAPPGGLALDCLHHFATANHKEFTKIMLENSCRSEHYQCPFAVVAIRLTRLLADLLRLGEPPVDDSQVYHRVLFKDAGDQHPFVHLFSVCAQLLNKTWREMRATVDDTDKVLSVVREQISRSLKINPASLPDLQRELDAYPYPTIQGIWKQERMMREQHEYSAKPILELRERIKPEIVQLIRKNRLNFLREGATFPKYTKGLKSSREKGKFWFWRLTSNDKTFQYDEVAENEKPIQVDQMRTMAVSDIAELVESPAYLKDAGKFSKKHNTNLAFSLKLKDSDDVVNFVAQDLETFNIWTDGINALLGKDMTSQLAKTDLDTLLNLEVKMRLLDAEGIEIPDVPPPIPPPPPNLDFCYEFK